MKPIPKPFNAVIAEAAELGFVFLCVLRALRV